MVPLISLLEHMNPEIVGRKVMGMDASVAITNLKRGYSRAMQYMRKTQAVDLAWASSVLKQESIELYKLESAKNTADIMTKVMDERTLVRLTEMLGVGK